MPAKKNTTAKSAPAQTFGEFVRAEVKRQRSEGFDVPQEDEKNDAWVAWKSEAARHFAAANPSSCSGQEFGGGEIEKLVKQGNNEVTLEELEELQRQLETAPFPSADSQVSNLPCMTSEVNGPAEIASSLESYELTLRLYFYDQHGNTSSLASIIKKMKPSVVSLRNQGIIGYTKNKFPELTLVFELACYRRLRAHWDKIDDKAKEMADLGLVNLCGFFGEDPSYKKLANAVTQKRSTNQTIDELLCAAVQKTTLSFPHLFQSIKKTFPSALPPKVAPTVEETGEPSPPRRVVEQEQRKQPPGSNENRQRENSKRGREGQQQQLERDDIQSVSTRTGSRSVSQQHRQHRERTEPRAGTTLPEQQERPSNGQGGPTLEELFDLGGSNSLPMKRAHMEERHQKSSQNVASIVNGITSRLGAGGGNSNNKPSSVLTVGGGGGAANSNNGGAGAAADNGNGNAKHRFPCQSKYHKKYSSDSKHASGSCRYCGPCHMMEFLFNGCTRDCTWKHYPTPKKIALVLGKFPPIENMAKKRLIEMQSGADVGPSEIPL